ncbi:MAG: dienelactone hydrolase family protein [Acidobacteria bacterium]|nr:dienelactone hydrolase family protein [Acidobacteriota bacterium]
MTISRRQFFEWLTVGGGGLLAGSSTKAENIMENFAEPALSQKMGVGTHLGNLHAFVQKQADRSPLELSFLHPEFRDLKKWQPRARAKVFEHLFYTPPPIAPQPQLIKRTDRGDYIEEYLTFQTTPDQRIPAYVLIPKNVRLPAPGIVVHHSHDGRYLWGKEKVVEVDNEHPVLTEFKQWRYGGKSIAAELARQGYVVIAIDMLFWGERRMLLDDDPPVYRERPLSMTEEQINAFNQRASQYEYLVGRSLMVGGVTWPGVTMWDDIRTLDYLASRPEVDRRRLGCVGLSVGGYRSYMLAVLDERIKATVNVGWMTSFASQIKAHIVHSTSLSFNMVGLYRYMDFPDLAALIAPRAALIINGSQDHLFSPEGVKAAFDKIGRLYAKAGAADRQRCSLYDTPHEFNLEMQAEAWKWLKQWV